MPSRPLLRPLLLWALLCATSAACRPDDEPPAQAHDPEPRTPERVLEEARQALDAREWDRVLTLAEEALVANPQLEAARALRAQAEAALDHRRVIDEAKALFDAGRYYEAELKLGSVPNDSPYFESRQYWIIKTQHATTLPETVPRGDGMTMHRVLIGNFRRGSTDLDLDRALQTCAQTFRGGPCQRDWYISELPDRQVYLNTVFIDEKEVSVDQYDTCVAASACSEVNWTACDVDVDTRRALEQPDLPQVCVTWAQADAYCLWVRMRLPTEAEWEKAAAGPDQLRYPWGNDWKSGQANWGDQGGLADGHVALAPVDAYGPHASGLFNMAGNAMEWTNDWYDDAYYADAPPRDPQGPDAGVARVVRGGSYRRSGDTLRTRWRGRMDPQTADQTVGFRCATGVERR